MSNDYKIAKGLDIRMVGKAETVVSKAPLAAIYAIKPADFYGFTPRLLVKVGDKVKAGTAVLFDKYNHNIVIASPVSGEVTAINRGERRLLLEVVITPEKEQQHEQFEVDDLLSLNREQVVEKLLASGCWPFIKQRPYGIIASPSSTPRGIFISCFDSSPLAPDFDILLRGEEEYFYKGIEVLKKLTEGKIYLGVNAEFASPLFEKCKGVEINRFRGPHPAGNVGTQINIVSPINKGDVVWTIDPQHVVSIGRLADTGHYDVQKTIAVVGSEVKKPRYYKIIQGASIKDLIEGDVSTNKNIRFISGSILSGTRISSEGFIGFYDNMLAVIPEGDQYELFGWALLGLDKFSFSKSFLTWLMPSKDYVINTNFHGGERAFVMSDVYGKVFPFDIYPVHLLKAILAEDVDAMERLGIYEVIEEDFALCEFVDPSKIEIQAIIRKGLNLMIKEMC
jgi:Na+-transporting NADH:ubiquinone oxidoreductase subunit A